MWKMSLFGFVVSLISAGMIYVNWQEVWSEGTYSFRIAGLAPLGVVLGLYLMLLLPTVVERIPAWLNKLLIFLLIVVGMAAGFYNWYLMDPDQFNFLIR